jgi:hypothetical protein
MKKHLLGAGLFVLAAAAGATIWAGRAQAAPVRTTFTCSQGVAQITWDGGGLFIDCVGQPNRFAAYSFNVCSGYFGNIDNVKVFESIANSAFLSGHTLVISYDTPASCTGSNVGAITALTLQP